MIPAAQPQMRNANDWETRFETVRSTFSSKVGQICNAALDQSIVAYNEALPEEERRNYREATETLAIFTGLEIDSAKSGVKPNLSAYLGKRTRKRSAFLQYKTLLEAALIKDYGACLSRIRARSAAVQNKARKQDIDRILYARGQEEQVDTDTLYALFGALPPQRVTELWEAIAAQRWHLLSPDERERFLLAQLPEPEFADWYDLLADFRHGGFRVLGDLVCDLDEENTRRPRGLAV